MKVRSFILAFLLCLFALSTASAQNPNMGTWKLNEAKSKIPAGAGKSTTVVYSTSGGDIKITTDGLNGQGRPSYSEWTGKFDAKPILLPAFPDVTYLAYKSKGDRTLLFASMKGDKTVSNGRSLVAKDGSSRSVTITYFGNKKIRTNLEYDKQ